MAFHRQGVRCFQLDLLEELKRDTVITSLRMFEIAKECNISEKTVRRLFPEMGLMNFQKKGKTWVKLTDEALAKLAAEEARFTKPVAEKYEFDPKLWASLKLIADGVEGLQDDGKAS